LHANTVRAGDTDADSHADAFAESDAGIHGGRRHSDTVADDGADSRWSHGHAGNDTDSWTVTADHRRHAAIDIAEPGLAGDSRAAAGRRRRFDHAVSQPSIAIGA
jgi:hypothetical protein